MKYAPHLLTLCLVAGGLLALTPAAAAHKFHTSFTEADYDAEEHSLQITLRTFPDDVENVLSKRAGKSVSLDRKEEAAPLLLAYLQETFRLKDAGGEIVKLSWVGMEAGADSAWLYFEAKLPAGLRGVALSNQFLCDLFADQVNLVNVKEGGRKHSLTYERGGGFQPLAPK